VAESSRPRTKTIIHDGDDKTPVRQQPGVHLLPDQCVVILLSHEAACAWSSGAVTGQLRAHPPTGHVYVVLECSVSLQALYV
jgi:hypothetical protein